MPLLSNEEIREKFYEFANPTITGREQSEGIDQFYPKKYNKEIADHFLAQRTADMEYLKGEVEKIKKQPIQVQVPCPENKIGCVVYHCEYRLSQEDKIYNQALDDLLSSITSPNEAEK